MNLLVVFSCLLWIILTNHLEFSTCQEDPVLNQLVADFWSWRTTEFAPLESFSYQHFQTRVNVCDKFLQRAKDIDLEKLIEEDQLTLKLMKYQLETFIDGYKWVDYGALNPINFMSNPLNLPYVTKETYNTYSAYMSYIEELNRIPAQIEEIRTLLHNAVQLNRTNHAVSMKGVLETIYSMGRTDPRDSLFYSEFERIDSAIAITSEEKQTLKNRGLKTIERILKEYVRLGDWMKEEYMPHTRAKEGVWCQKNGNQYYEAVLKWHLSYDLHPETVHTMGLREVSIIKRKMERIMRQLGFKGNLTAFFSHLKNQTQFYNHTQEEYLHLYKDAIYRRIKPRLEPYFPNLQDIPELIVRQSSSDGIVAYYWFPIMAINTNNPQTRENFTVLAISLHEGLPGHHLQVSYMRSRTELPDFRRFVHSTRKHAVPFSFPFYTAYIEGWGLYAEYMGEEMGLFTDLYELFGRYIFEMFRACRLVVDTGIHYKGWSKEKAVNYIQKHTVLQKQLVELEVDRYITWPGQACSYKVGELKIKELRKKAEETLGYKFTIIDFHETVLKHGALPLNLLEDVVNNWIETRLNSTTSSSPRHFLSSLLYILTLRYFLVQLINYIHM